MVATINRLRRRGRVHSSIADGFACDDERIRLRIAQDVLLEAVPAYWLRRAKVFEWARPRPDDFTGDATRQELAEQDARLTAKAQACRHRAELASQRDTW